MSRSYKKNPVFKPKPRNRSSKKICNRLIRSKLKNFDYEIYNNDYKKVVYRWDYFDGKCRITKQEATGKYFKWIKEEEFYNWSYFSNRYPTLKSYIRRWGKHFFRK